ncbi:coiled-coil domain-containing protein 103 [Bacillus rossius redtenbacheri]|uniref:coiled-coil domain-containing protein 103 n=1 Tax=Bacillus rossius redtenbacheri TaxID=93214 RepID=UPI002FDDFF46
MAEDEDSVDLSALEAELQAAIDDDARYWRENDAKLRAVEQKVATYDEFKDIVKACHLRPLDKEDKLGHSKKATVWNSMAAKKQQSLALEMTQHCVPTSIKGEETRVPATMSEFAEQWRPLDICDRLQLLKRMGPATLGQVLRTEIPVGTLGEILQALLAFPPTTDDIILVVQLLEALAQAKRFSLSLRFLSSVEKATCRQLMEKLNSSLQNRQQDLAEHGVTEWSVLELKNKYSV